MHREPEQETSVSKDFAQAFSFLYLTLAVWALTIYLPIRSGSGKEHCGFKGILGLVFPCLFFLCVPDTSVMLIFPVFFVGLFLHRIGHLRAYWYGERVHTQYSGKPWLALRLQVGQNEIAAKTVTEPLLVLIVGSLLYCVFPGLGLYYVLGAFAMCAKQVIDNMTFQRQLDQVADGMIENEYLQSQSRGLRR